MEHVNYNVKIKLVLERCTLSRTEVIGFEARTLTLASSKYMFV